MNLLIISTCRSFLEHVHTSKKLRFGSTSPRSRDSNGAKMFTNKWPQHFPTDLVAIFAKELGHTGGRFTTLASSAWVTTKVLATKTHQVVGFLSHLQMVWCVYLQIWVKGGLFCGANFETEGLRGLKYIGNFNCSLKNLMAETLPFFSIGKMYYCR